MGIENPQGIRDEEQQVVGIERDRVRVSSQWLTAISVGIEQRQIAGLHRLGLHPFLFQMRIENIAQVERVRAANQR